MSDASPSLRMALRIATDETHNRLHSHGGLAAVKDGRIDLPRYRLLLQRLHGFHRPFEVAVGLSPLRSGWLARDLAAVGAMPVAAAAEMLAFTTPAARLGALYVVEGAALGGHGLARALGGLLGRDAIAGRRFFACDGADPGVSFRSFIARLGEMPSSEAPAVVEGAVRAFAIFETWLDGWERADA